jgi:hypothetical protein
MTRPPDLDELVGLDVEQDERDRLLRVHALLVAAGPPSELPPGLEAGPTLAMTMGRRQPRPVRRRVMLLAAAIVVVAVAFLGGYLAGNNGGGLASAMTLHLAGTPTAPAAFASLSVEAADAAGNWPMKLAVTGLPTLPAHAVYEVYLVRNGKPYAPCGTFIVAGGNAATTVTLNAPYRLHHGDSWIVTRVLRGEREPGTVVLRPTV